MLDDKGVKMIEDIEAATDGLKCAIREYIGEGYLEPKAFFYHRKPDGMKADVFPVYDDPMQPSVFRFHAMMTQPDIFLLVTEAWSKELTEGELAEEDLSEPVKEKDGAKEIIVAIFETIEERQTVTIEPEYIPDTIEEVDDMVIVWDTPEGSCGRFCNILYHRGR